MPTDQMIRLTKQPEPEVLVANGAAWRDEYLAAIAAGGDIPDATKYRYRHPGIKAVLRVETSAKCAYCESKIAPVAPEHVEHLLAKTVRPELIVEWSNLTLACPECNSRKGGYYSEVEPLLNPYMENPEEHLLFYGPLVLGTNAKGERTALRLDLCRGGLLERKTTRIKALHHLVLRWQQELSPVLRNLLEEQIREEAAPNSEYTATVRSYLLDIGFPL